ncbi:hypothetical protein E8E11_007567 [Didymella keratinophila]|nr:hypothetical protein E8E11_007567 [Didymella keratinophila]
MALLELPPELFQIVVTHFVTRVGVARAWKKRVTCRALQIAIDCGIFAKQPLEAFTGKKALKTEGILTNRAASYLSYRVEVLNGADKFLPRVINRVLSAIGLDRVNADGDLRRHVSAKLCGFLTSQVDVYCLLIGQADVDAAEAEQTNQDVAATDPILRVFVIY